MQTIHFCEYLTAFREHLKTFYFQVFNSFSAVDNNVPSVPVSTEINIYCMLVKLTTYCMLMGGANYAL